MVPLSYYLLPSSILFACGIPLQHEQSRRVPGTPGGRL
jgi:hypothetical protein